MPNIAERNWPKANWLNLLALGLISRVVFLCLASQAPLGDPNSPMVDINSTSVQAELDTPLRRPLQPWYRWDALLYLKIARIGYEYKPGQFSTATFLPLLPVLMAAGSMVGLDIFWVGSIVPNLAFALGLVAFGRTAARVTGDDGVAWRACLLLIAFPTSFYFSAPYEESLGFALSAWAIWFWIDRKPLGSAISIAFSTASRLVCVAFPVAIGAEWLNDLIHRRKPRPWALPVALAGAIGIGSFCLYIGYSLGDPLLPFKGQSLWKRKPPGFLGLWAFAQQLYATAVESRMFTLAVIAIILFLLHRWLIRRLPAFLMPDPAGWVRFVPPVLLLLGTVVVVGAFQSPRGSLPYRILGGLDQRDNLSFVFFAGLGLVAWIRRGPFWGCLVLVPLAIAASTGVPMSFCRFVLMSYPAFIDLAELLGKRWAYLGALMAGFAGQYWLFVRYSSVEIFIA